MSYSLKVLEKLYSECISLPQEKRSQYIAEKANGNKLLEETLELLTAKQLGEDKYLEDLHRKIIDSFDPNFKKDPD